MFRPFSSPCQTWWWPYIKGPKHVVYLLTPYSLIKCGVLTYPPYINLIFGIVRLSVPVHRVCWEEMSDIYKNGYDMLPEIPRYNNVNARQRKERRKGLGTEFNPDHGSKTLFYEEVLPLYSDIIVIIWKSNSDKFFYVSHKKTEAIFIFANCQGVNACKYFWPQWSQISGAPVYFYAPLAYVGKSFFFLIYKHFLMGCKALKRLLYMPGDVQNT